MSDRAVIFLLCYVVGLVGTAMLFQLRVPNRRFGWASLIAGLMVSVIWPLILVTWLITLPDDGWFPD